MMKVCRTIEKVAPTNATTLLLGESGTGKEVFARAMHSLSSARRQSRSSRSTAPRSPKRCSSPSCSASRRARSPGAVKQTPGKIEVADGGTLFLDEIGDMPLPLQAKLLRFLQERTFERIGGRTEIPVDVRVVCATNKNLPNAMASGAFPRRSLLPNQRDHDQHSAGARARRRPDRARRALAQQVLRSSRAAVVKGFTDDGHDAIERTTGPATCARWRTRSRPR